MRECLGPEAAGLPPVTPLAPAPAAPAPLPAAAAAAGGSPATAGEQQQQQQASPGPGPHVVRVDVGCGQVLHQLVYSFKVVLPEGQDQGAGTGTKLLALPKDHPVGPWGLVHGRRVCGVVRWQGVEWGSGAGWLLVGDDAFGRYVEHVQG